MKTIVVAIVGAATLWTACVINQGAHADNYQVSLLPQHLNISDSDIHHIIIVSIDDDCDDSDPTWMPAPPTGVLSDTKDEGFIIEFSQPRSSRFLFSDECDDDDPSWIPAPPFSAIVTIGQSGGRAWELQDETHLRAREIIKHLISANSYPPEDTDGTLSFTLTEAEHFQQEMQKILDQWVEDNVFLNHALSDGHVPYLFLRSRGN